MHGVFVADAAGPGYALDALHCRVPLGRVGEVGDEGECTFSVW